MRSEESEARGPGGRAIGVGVAAGALVLLAPTLVVAGAVPRPAPETLRVMVDPRVELLSIVFRLAGNPEYNMAQIASYAADVDSHFGPFRGHPAVQMASRLREERGVGFDAVMRLAIHLQEIPLPGGPDGDPDGGPPPARIELRPVAPLTDELSLYEDGRWSPEEAARFLELLRDFVQDTDYAAFLGAHERLFAQVQERARAVVERELDAAWFAAFFGIEQDGPLTVVPGLLNGGANYGPRFRAPGMRERLYAIVGISTTDADGIPTLDPSQLRTVVHEFNHSYVNPVVERHRQELERAGERAYAAVADAMAAQAYADWKTMIDESLVRASVVRYLRTHRDAAAAEAELARQEDRSFLWIRPLEELLGEYEAQRGRYPTFADFMPRIVEFFDALAPRVGELVAARERQVQQWRPQIARTLPEDGATGVAPGLRRIVIEFDRPMRTGYQVNPAEAGEYPEINHAGFESSTLFVLEVRLRPDTRYALTLNTDAGGAFRDSGHGVPLTRTLLRFTTGSGPSPR